MHWTTEAESDEPNKQQDTQEVLKQEELHDMTSKTTIYNTEKQITQSSKFLKVIKVGNVVLICKIR